jgi:MoaA/NifB/PqqE/SkfB family radical SAM enzyme
MRSRVRWRYLARAPRILWNALGGRYDFTFDLMPMQARAMSWRKRANLLKAGLNLIHRRAVPWAWPLHMQIELVNYCDLRCPICPTGAGRLERRPAAVDLDLYRDVMRQAGPYLLTQSLWAWGEPLLHPQFAEVVRIAREYGVSPLISTNGQNLGDESVLQGLLDAPPTYLIVALDGLTEETYALNRPGAKLAPVLEGVHELRARRQARGLDLPVLHMRYIVTRQNQHEVERIRPFAVEHGFDYVSVRSLVIIDDDESEHLSRVPDDRRYRAYEYEGGARVRRRDYICQHAFVYPAIFADGTVTACDQDYNARHAYGRIGPDGSFADVWFGERAAEVRRTIRDAREQFCFCAHCPFADCPTNSATIECIDLRTNLADH